RLRTQPQAVTRLTLKNSGFAYFTLVFSPFSPSYLTKEGVILFQFLARRPLHERCYFSKRGTTTIVFCSQAFFRSFRIYSQECGGGGLSGRIEKRGSMPVAHNTPPSTPVTA